MRKVITKNAFGKAISDRSDLVYGSMEADLIDGKGGADAIYAKADDDLVIGGGGDDLINSGWGSDTLFFGRQHGADKVQDFDRVAGNNDVIAFEASIDSYFVVAETAGVRIVSVDDGVKQGSITLLGVTAAEWTSWGGALGHQTTDMGPAGNPLIDLDHSLIA
jgi:Ca2+-binding RTX toxin-like protein